MEPLLNQKEKFLLERLMQFVKVPSPETTQLVEHDISFDLLKVVSKLCDAIDREDRPPFSHVVIVCAKQSEMVRVRKYLHLFRRLQPSKRRLGVRPCNQRTISELQNGE